MSNEESEYVPIKLVVNTKNEASIGLIYKEQKSGKASKKKMIYKIHLKNVYEIENPTRDGIKERIFADHTFLKRTQQMETNIDKAIQNIFCEREQKTQKLKKQDQSESHENQEGSAAKIPTIKNK